jgi:hypothetical protein
MEMDFNVNDIVIIERNDLGAERIPMKYRHYINNYTYIYRAKIIRLCKTKPYHRVKPVPLTDVEIDDFVGTRKGYKSKIYNKNVMYYNCMGK